MKRMLAAALLVVLAGTASAQDKTYVTTSYSREAVPYLGSELREGVNNAMQAGSSDAGRAALKEALAWCDAKVSDDEVTYVAVENDKQAEEFAKTRPHAKRVVVLDVACPMAYKTMAYWAIEDRDLEGSLPWLDKAIGIAPYYADALCERGFTLNQLHRAAEAADNYRQALAILERYPFADSQGVALRGLGYSLVELGDLKGARKAYEDSLVAVPGNKTAQSEIEYIDGLEKQQK